MTRLKRRGGILLLLAVAVVSLFLPAVKLYIHSQLGEEVAGLFSPTLSSFSLMKGDGALPLSSVPALASLHFEGWMLTGGCVCLLVAACLGFLGSGWMLSLSLALSLFSAALSASFAMHLQNLAGSLLFSLMITVQWAAYVPLVCALAIAVWVLVIILKEKEGIQLSEAAWRRLMALFAAFALVCCFLPVYRVAVPATITSTSSDADEMNRSTSIFTYALGQEEMLNEGKKAGFYQDVMTGDLQELEKYSGNGNDLRGIFLIPSTSGNQVRNLAVLCAMALLLLTLILSLIPSVDKWFPVALSLLSLIAFGSSVLGMMSVGSGDMYSGASRQLTYMGLGSVTPWPLVGLVVLCLGTLAGVMCIRVANSPYFVNPIPESVRLRVVALTLAVIALALTLAPQATFSFYRPGKTKAVSSVTMTGVQMVTFSTPEDMLSPKDNKGKDMYTEEGAEDTLSLSAVTGKMQDMTRQLGLTSWASIALMLIGIAVLCMKKQRKIAIAAFLLSFGVRVVTWLQMSSLMPAVIGSAEPSFFLYATLPVLIFAAFFANFADMAELPKKYKLFLMMLPFLLAVFLFSYLPLYGWSYAFYNYKFGMPMSEQEFVGFKWFSEMVNNPGQRENIVRVLKNTFGMSGLNLLTSWLPMVFAIFLNEITRTRFKKFVQIFTTLPNFISWALVFSFAMCLFAMDTGIYSKFMLAIGAIKEPVAWLNSTEHIWLKMWGWNTWKGLGWGAIMYLAAIAGIDQEQYEAARVDGANRWHQMRYITLPGLLPTFFVLLMLSISNILNNGMEQYLVFQNPMNKATIEVLDLYVYNITIASRGTTLYSFATAIGILKTLVSVTLLFSANFVSKKLRGESIM